MIYNNRGKIRIYNKDKWENFPSNGEKVSGGIIDVGDLPNEKVEINANSIYRLPDGTLWMYQDGWVELSTEDPDLTTRETFRIYEDEADIILHLSDFTKMDEGQNRGYYTIELLGENISGKKIRFYYDETDLTEVLIGENLALNFEFNIVGKFTKPFRLYSEYYGGNSKGAEVTISVNLKNQSKWFSHLRHTLSDSKGKNEFRVDWEKVMPVSCVVQETNNRLLLDVDRTGTYIFYDDPDV